MTKPVGRPSKYNEDLLVKARKYIETYEELGDPIPMIAGLAVFIEVSRDTIYDWLKQEDKQVFSDIVSKLMALQEQKLFAGGLKNDFNASITKLALTKHGYTDKSETALTPGDGVTFNMSIQSTKPADK